MLSELYMVDRCPFCSQELGALNTYERTIHGKTINMCPNCKNAFKKIDSGKAFDVEAGKSYFRARLNNNETAQETIPFIREILGDNVSEEEIRAAATSTPMNNFTQSSPSGDSGLNIGGVVFLILAVVLYFISVGNSYGVANIQTTVFAAACFVAAVVCFAAGKIIRVINRKQ